MVRCEKYEEDECLGHDCLDRVGAPCVFDRRGIAGTEDIVDRECEMGTCPANYDRENSECSSCHHLIPIKGD
jgi:hypothetical protein